MKNDEPRAPFGPRGFGVSKVGGAAGAGSAGLVVERAEHLVAEGLDLVPETERGREIGLDLLLFGVALEVREREGVGDAVGCAARVRRERLGEGREAKRALLTFVVGFVALDELLERRDLDRKSVV